MNAIVTDYETENWTSDVLFWNEISGLSACLFLRALKTQVIRGDIWCPSWLIKFFENIVTERDTFLKSIDQWESATLCWHYDNEKGKSRCKSWRVFWRVFNVSEVSIFVTVEISTKKIVRLWRCMSAYITEIIIIVNDLSTIIYLMIYQLQYCK